MKRFIYFIVFLLVVLIGGALIGPSFVDWNQYKGQATAKIKEVTGLDVALNGDIGFVVIPVPKLMAHYIVVSSPEGAKNANIATLKRFDVNVSLIPLLSGKVDVQSVSLIEPVINIEIDKEGNPVFMTDKINALIAPQDSEVQSAAPSAMPEISFQNVTVKDAVITYFDHKSEGGQKLQNINFELSASNLTGPYKINGHMFYEGKAINIDVDAGSLDLKEKVISLKSKVSVSPDDIHLSYAGAVNFTDSVTLQGQIGLEAAAKSQYISKPIKGQGFLTADQSSVKLTDLEVASEGDVSISGDVEYVIEGGKFSANLKSASPVDGQALLGPSFPFGMLAFDIAASGDMQKISLKDSSVTLDKSKLQISGNYSMPKEGKAKLDIDIKSDHLDLDKLAAGGGNKQQSLKQALKESVQSLALPFDLDLLVSAKKLKYGDFDLSNFNLGASLKGKSVTIKEFGAYGLFGTYTTVKGSVGDINTISGLDLTASVKIDNIKTFKNAFALNDNAQVDLLDKASVNTSLKGGLEAVDMTSNIKAKGADIYLKGKISDPVGKMSIAGLSLQIKHPNTQKFLVDALDFADTGYDLGKALDFYTDFSMSGDQYKLGNIKASIASLSLTGKMDVQTKEKRPYVKGDLNIGGVLASKPVKQAAGRWSKEPISTEVFSAVDADIGIKSEGLVLKDFTVLSHPSFSLQMKDGKMDIKDFYSEVFGGTIRMAVSIKSVPNEPKQPLHITSKGEMQRISIKAMSDAMIGKNVIKAEGMVDGSFDIVTSGLNQAAMVHDLSGNAVLDGKKITIHGLDIKRFARALSDDSKPGDSVVSLWKGASSGGSTYFDTLDGKFTIKEGIVNIDKLDLDGPQALLQSIGKVSLPQWSLNTKHKITSKIESEGEKEIPPFEINFSGPLDNPSQTFAQGLLQDYLKRKIDRKLNKVLGDIIGGKSNDNAPPPAQEGQEAQGQEPASGSEKKRPDPEDLIKGVLEDLLR